MQRIFRALGVGLLGGTALLAVSGAAYAADLGYKDEAPTVEEARKFGLALSITGTTDYIFRGLSQTSENPTVQGQATLTYGIAYLTVWSSGIDWGGPSYGSPDNADVEVDIYGGIKPVWRGITFDLGVLAYLYPHADEKAAHLPGSADYYEFKIGASKEVWTGLTLGATVYYSPEYQYDNGNEWTFEGTATKTLGKWRGFDLALSGTLGYTTFEDKQNFGFDDYLYWNVGLSATRGAYTFDVRYWDTNLGKNEPPALDGVFDGGARVVGTITVNLPELFDHREPLK